MSGEQYYKFFEISIQIEREYQRLTDLIYRRYGGSVQYILSMPFFEGYELLKYALDAEKEDRIFMRWVVGHQFSMDFNEFKRNLSNTQAVDDNRTAEEILDTVKDIIG